MSVELNDARCLTADLAWNTFLPNETLAAIFRGLSPSVLATIAPVSRQWRGVAEWLLYSNISISETLSTSSPFPYSTLRCCQTIRLHSHLASGLSKLYIRWKSEHGAHYEPDFDLLLSNLSQAIGLAINLESLDLHLGLPCLPEHPTLTSLTFPATDVHYHSLRRVSLSGIGPFAHNRLTHFLNILPAARHLRLPDYHDQIALLPQALPSLISFSGSPRVAAAILPGRPVQSLVLIGQDYITDLDLSRMALTSIPLRHLDLSSMLVTPTLLRNLSRNLNTVESLKVKLALRHTLHFAGIGLLAALSHLLSAFHRLSTLDLSPTHVDYTGLSNSAEELSLCRSWQNACPSLRRVVFPSQTEWTLQEDDNTWLSVLLGGSRRRVGTFLAFRDVLLMTECIACVSFVEEVP
ncbi:hypothetical protein DEU56DRAFT_744160 [Suillus clintonianus]|uniref:uncharacterized protein n=1 Tax=Suillus clintonianus TaxID=1904413 RepID=UPI001B877DB0|nr:uncharacterized protein DEU56DRAFT_744160 [Suillus clintonianus]KAG2125049.1 hypothetical protein DEU56DRAFT_744160 [Suillus clintonianus]